MLTELAGRPAEAPSVPLSSHYPPSPSWDLIRVMLAALYGEREGAGTKGNVT